MSYEILYFLQKGTVKVPEDSKKEKNMRAMGIDPGTYSFDLLEWRIIKKLCLWYLYYWRRVA